MDRYGRPRLLAYAQMRGETLWPSKQSNVRSQEAHTTAQVFGKQSAFCPLWFFGVWSLFMYLGVPLFLHSFSSLLSPSTTLPPSLPLSPILPLFYLPLSLPPPPPSLPTAHASPIDVDELYAELEIMKHIEPHPNILNLLGQCSQTGKQACCDRCGLIFLKWVRIVWAYYLKYRRWYKCMWSHKAGHPESIAVER